jgi:hypothetical protein
MDNYRKGYNFSLSRIQRLRSLIAEWWRAAIFLCISVIFLISNSTYHPIVVVFAGLLLLFFFRGLTFGIIDLFYNSQRHVEIEDRGVGFGRDKADWWIFTDGIKEIRNNSWGTISIRHHNGTYVDIPTELLSLEDYQKLEVGMKKYREFRTNSAS